MRGLPVLDQPHNPTVPAPPGPALELGEHWPRGMLQCCLNGARDRASHPRLPVSPDDIVDAAIEVAAFGFTTGAWTASSADRLASVRGWGVLPDHASVNWHEDGADAVAAEAVRSGRTILRRVDAVPRHQVLLHGEGDTAWALVREAVTLDVMTRIGLEDPSDYPTARVRVVIGTLRP